MGIYSAPLSTHSRSRTTLRSTCPTLRASRTDVHSEKIFVKYSLPEFLNFELFGKTVLVANIKFGLFFWAIHSASENTRDKLRDVRYVPVGYHVYP